MCARALATLLETEEAKSRAVSVNQIGFWVKFEEFQRTDCGLYSVIEPFVQFTYLNNQV
jgi:hypothetical protein